MNGGRGGRRGRGSRYQKSMEPDPLARGAVAFEDVTNQINYHRIVVNAYRAAETRWQLPTAGCFCAIIGDGSVARIEAFLPRRRFPSAFQGLEISATRPSWYRPLHATYQRVFKPLLAFPLFLLIGPGHLPARASSKLHYTDFLQISCVRRLPTSKTC